MTPAQLAALTGGEAALRGGKTDKAQVPAADGTTEGLAALGKLRAV